MTIAYWPGLGGGAASLIEVEPVLRERGLDVVVVDPRYGRRDDWSLGALAEELASSRADVYAGHSWGAAVAAAAAVLSPPRALVLLDGGHIGPRDFHRLGAAATTDERVAEIRTEHDGHRWPSEGAYLDWCRSAVERWNDALETSALEGMRRVGDELLPPFDSDQLEAIVRGYEEYDAVGTLTALRPDIRVLLVAAAHSDEHAEERDAMVLRFRELVPSGQAMRVASGHDVVWGLGPELGTLVADWLASSGAVE